MTVKPAQELICDCRLPGCRRDGYHRCDTAITDYAKSVTEVRAIGKRQGWTTRPADYDGRVTEDLCPACARHWQAELDKYRTEIP